jgi:hypothetical protein
MIMVIFEVASPVIIVDLLMLSAVACLPDIAITAAMTESIASILRNRLHTTINHQVRRFVGFLLQDLLPLLHIR